MPRLSYEEAKSYIESKGDTLLSSDYHGVNELLDIKCGECNGEYKQCIKRIRKGYQHPYCPFKMRKNNNKRFTYENVQDYITSTGDILLSEKYVNIYGLLDLKCGDCGDNYQENFDRIRKGCKHYPCKENPDREKPPEIKYITKICEFCGNNFKIVQGRKNKLCSPECLKLLNKEKSENGFFKNRENWWRNIC